MLHEHALVSRGENGQGLPRIFTWEVGTEFSGGLPHSFFPLPYVSSLFPAPHIRGFQAYRECFFEHMLCIRRAYIDYSIYSLQPPCEVDGTIIIPSGCWGNRHRKPEWLVQVHDVIEPTSNPSRWPKASALGHWATLPHDGEPGVACTGSGKRRSKSEWGVGEGACVC